MPELIIVGGGPAGLSAAITLKRSCPKLSVLLLEKKDRVGKKILATGNGRCNLSNRDMELSHFHGSAASLVPEVFRLFGPQETEEFWAGLGIEYRELEEGKLYPYSLQASAVLDALRFEAEHLGIRILTSARVTELHSRKGGYELFASVEGKNTKYRADALILAAGGAASPAFGSDGDGLRLCRGLGLKTSPHRPALCRLRSDAADLKSLAGTKAVARLSLADAGGQEQAFREGELLFTQEGLSGPPVLQLSRLAGELCGQGGCLIQADFFPEFSQGELFARLLKHFSSLSHLTALEILGGLIHKKIAGAALKRAGLSVNAAASSLGKKELSRLASQLKGMEFPITGPEGFEEAQVSTGGVIASELGAGLEAARFPGLYLCGELVDLDGDCGGYNLQWAVSSGCAAALSASLRFSEA